jgi:hypothetical protein
MNPTIITYGKAAPVCVFCPKTTRLVLVNIGLDRAVWMCRRHAKHGPTA